MVNISVIEERELASITKKSLKMYALIIVHLAVRTDSSCWVLSDGLLLTMVPPKKNNIFPPFATLGYNIDKFLLNCLLINWNTTVISQLLTGTA
jgi:hypothetical protein